MQFFLSNSYLTHQIFTYMRCCNYHTFFFATAIVSSAYLTVNAQSFSTPDSIYQRLFTDVQLNRIFPDSKTFVDMVPKRSPQAIVADYEHIRNTPNIKFSIKTFVEENFYLPQGNSTNYTTQQVPITTHIKQLWQVLKRQADVATAGSSLLPLPNPYIVPGGRFREVYYWDSYFTMLGLAESGEWATIEHMIDNFAYLIDRFGHIPNGNRSYYLSRSQPPFFAMMVDLLAKHKGKATWALYKNALQKEYDYWNDKNGRTKHRVIMPDGSILQRYWDANNTPRQESYYEDYTLVYGEYDGMKKPTIANAANTFRHLRSGAESGWDFSTRWFADGKHLKTIETTNIVPVDLNGLIYQLELALAKANEASGNLTRKRYYEQLALRRKKAIHKYCWNAKKGYFFDYHILHKRTTNAITAAGITPAFFGIATPQQTAQCANIIEQQLLQPGGLVTTTTDSEQQWDAPNGWAPLQYMAVVGLHSNGQTALAKTIAERWINLNIKVYQQTGKLMEKYNVVDTTKEAGGGEYPGQDGFGWTNGVLLKLLAMYPVNTP
ncbi:MAG: alpha,alpha-trehalase TreA [Chitinophagaceae bacterium]